MALHEDSPRLLRYECQQETVRTPWTATRVHSRDRELQPLEIPVPLPVSPHSGFYIGGILGILDVSLTNFRTGKYYSKKLGAA